MKKGKKSRKTFTTGQLNRVKDDLVHPLLKEDQNYIWVDGVLHGLVEQNPKLSMNKYVKYNVPKLLKTKRKPARLKP